MPLRPTGAFDVLQRMGKEQGLDLVVVTSRQHVIQDQTLSWIDKHYPGIFQVCLPLAAQVCNVCLLQVVVTTEGGHQQAARDLSKDKDDNCL